MNFNEPKRELRFASKEAAFSFRDAINKPPYRLTGKAKARPTLPTRNGSMTIKNKNDVFSVWFTAFALPDYFEIAKLHQQHPGATIRDKNTGLTSVVESPSEES